MEIGIYTFVENSTSISPEQRMSNLLEEVELADQVFLFKRTVRQAALKHDMYATFMAKPHANEPGSSMHIHQSVMDRKTGKNVFAGPNGKPSRLFLNHIGGLQRYMGAAMPFCAPNVNSYRRLVPNSDAPTNTHWGIDNRTAPLRVPSSDADNMRVENRVPGADANPYLAIAASLACGYLGMVEGLACSDPVNDGANDDEIVLPRGLLEAVALFEECEELVEIFGKGFVATYRAIKQAEFETFMQVISPWEREYLLLNV